jgi:cell division protein FtsI/penicillin-binding protein 2
LTSFAVALANGGHFFRPYGGPLKNRKPRRVKELSWRPRTLEVLRAGMQLAISEGTAHNAAVPGTAIAGKTGTASRLDDPKRNYGWFLGFAPASRPRIAVCVLIDDATGCNEASSAARLVFSAFLKKGKK